MRINIQGSIVTSDSEFINKLNTLLKESECLVIGSINTVNEDYIDFEEIIDEPTSV